MTWLYLRKGGFSDEGPIAAGRVRHMIEKGELPFGAQVRLETEEDWQDAHDYFGVTPSCSKSTTDQSSQPINLTEPESLHAAKHPLLQFAMLASKLLQIAAVNAGLVSELGGFGYVVAVVFAPMFFMGRVMGYGLIFALLGAYAGGWQWWWLALMVIGEMFFQSSRGREAVQQVRNADHETAEKVPK